MVSEACERLGCAYVVLFGSQATGEARVYSDVDLAVRFIDGRDCMERCLDLACRLEESLGIRVDVVAIDMADSLLKYEVFSRGKLLYCRDRDRYLDDRVNAIDEYLDFKPVFERFYRRTVREIRSAISRGES